MHGCCDPGIVVRILAGAQIRSFGPLYSTPGWAADLMREDTDSCGCCCDVDGLHHEIRSLAVVEDRTSVHHKPPGLGDMKGLAIRYLSQHLAMAIHFLRYK